MASIIDESRLGSPNHVLSSDVPAEAREKTCNKNLVASGPVFVFQDSPSRPVKFFVPGKPAHWPAQFRKDKQQETDAIFYSSNHFHFVDTKTRRETSILQAFLVSLTSTHAHLLSHVSLSFPALEAAQERPEVLAL
ncbi:hypothetical protein FPSE5266_07443 [Fusarium pseudograminearum]|nr:hypothetical protein FPSE5266_07443 [Fusarium pseudograminearum]